MTFYWWSHWFWITMFMNILFFITVVHTYPSQEINSEYNQNSKQTKSVTRLYQASTTLTWATTAPSITQIMDLTQTERSSDIGIEESNLKETSMEEIAEAVIEGFEMEMDKNDEEEGNAENEYKRSAEHLNNRTDKEADLSKQEKAIPYNETHENVMQLSKKPTFTMTEDDSFDEKLSNPSETIISSDQYNSSVNISNLSLNSTGHEVAVNTTESAHLSSPSAPSAPHIDTASAVAAEWLNTAIGQMPTAISHQQPEDIASNLVTTSAIAQKIPFTLENANKEDELRRAENEHRSRKSKVLSAEYKHINRYINYSSDPKSLLTRSASAAPHEFDNDSESNISSEALAIQRTYFLDAGAISAICFTVFGICCTVGTIGVVLYRRRYLNKPQTLSEPDSSVYIDDSTMRVSDNSDEMYSLDNDSFLNSLEAMTIQNYWTDTVKHTKL